jgi:hypothetical protein
MFHHVAQAAGSYSRRLDKDKALAFKLEGVIQSWRQQSGEGRAEVRWGKIMLT